MTNLRKINVVIKHKPTHSSACFALSYCKALSHKSLLESIFFHQDGVYNATSSSILYPEYAQIAATTNCKLLVCKTSCEMRSISIDINCFAYSSLTYLAEKLIDNKHNNIII